MRLLTNKIKKFFLDLFFPKKCLSCGKDGTYLCQTCLDKIEIAKSEIKNGKLVTTQLKLSDIKIGDQVSVQAEEVIKDQTEFEARSIQLFSAPEMPTPPQP